MKLSKSIAQKIVLEMMNVIPYNINVMDDKGIIIGSGDINRIGHIHEGAKKSIKSKQIIEVYYSNEKMKPGVNEPIILNNNVIGVIGITGHPDEVRRFSKLVTVTASLLIEQARTDETILNRRLNREKFYYELAHRKTEYDAEFSEIAKSFGMDISKKYEAIIVEGNLKSQSFKKLCDKFPYYTEINNRVVFFINTKQLYTSLISKLEQDDSIKKVSIGSKEKFAAISLEQADLALEFGKKIKPLNKIYSYDELKAFIHLSHINKDEYSSIITNLRMSGSKLELVETLQVYIEENGDINSVANKLRIHRNTLNYRLDRITQLTGKNPKNFLELFELLCGLLWN